jgi:hypothetical protein
MNSAFSLAERFWQKVNKGAADKCWNWTGSLNRRGGYGRIKRDDQNIVAHRVSWELHFGDVPADRCVCHKCDNPRCVNPTHLFLGTVAENMADMVAKGRQRSNPPRGELCNFATLKAADVLLIRKLHAAGVKGAELSKQFGVQQTAISKIVHRKRWTHV